MHPKSAGIILYRFRYQVPEILLVHPGGPFWAKKDDGAWSIPKGEFAENENPLDAAKREMEEETGIRVTKVNIELKPVRIKSGKTIFAWGTEGDFDVNQIRSNNFELEWPPKSGKKKLFPEIDKAGWFEFAEAKRKITPGQLPLIEELENKLQ
jgi:predicted NUDIX family NTP pyrophosphohydrolase